jgi:hypothetical protein
MYLVSPQLLVTNEHIMSERASTPSSFFSGPSQVLVFPLSLFPLLLGGESGARVLRGVDSLASFGLLCEGDVGLEATVEELLYDCDRCLFSTSLFSKVPRSVRPLSSSLSSPKQCYIVIVRKIYDATYPHRIQEHT